KKIGVPVITLDGIKFRTHSMYGDCQGSQCRPHIAYMLWKRLGIKPWEISFKGGGSKYAYSEVKTLLRRGDGNA
ncbi:MAG: FAD/NAD(P)-binding oxidoreductase, partial [Crenarchaeota archaeon]|nr:FAD/NAD(P)-binding oxidoreductase [Thermoproteota archaeon]